MTVRYKRTYCFDQDFIWTLLILNDAEIEVAGLFAVSLSLFVSWSSQQKKGHWSLDVNISSHFGTQNQKFWEIALGFNSCCNQEI